MPSYAEQLVAARTAHDAASRIEDAVRAEIQRTFERWDAGEYDAQTVRHRLEKVIRASYRSSVEVAKSHAIRESQLPGWKPKARVFNNAYLQSLLGDVRRSLREYKSDRGDADRARRRAIMRMQHSAGVAAQRGFTDSMIAHFGELDDMGLLVSKIWVANFVNNQPCPLCTSLHGTEVGIHEDFKVPKDSKSKVYINLQGPPRHPRCRCYLVMLITRPENAFDTIDIDNPADEEARETTSDAVRSLPLAIFFGLLKTVMALINFLRGK